VRPCLLIAAACLLALCLGLTCFFGGAGIITALLLLTAESSDLREMSDAWPLGLIPVFVGIGLLLFYLLSKGLGSAPAGESIPSGPMRHPLHDPLGEARG